MRSSKGATPLSCAMAFSNRSIPSVSSLAEVCGYSNITGSSDSWDECRELIDTVNISTYKSGFCPFVSGQLSGNAFWQGFLLLNMRVALEASPLHPRRKSQHGTGTPCDKVAKYPVRRQKLLTEQVPLNGNRPRDHRSHNPPSALEQMVVISEKALR